MNRREFSLYTLGAAGLGATVPGLVQAQGGPMEGVHYVRLGSPAPVSAPAGQVEVVEFFWYGCPHCYEFEPALAAWVAKLPPYVTFRRVPVAFRERPFAAHQQLYYALEALGLVDTLHAKVFHAIHREGRALDNAESAGDFVKSHGVDKDKFLSVYNSFTVKQNKLPQARKLFDAYKGDGVPAIGVAGRYYTTVSLNGSAAKTLSTTNFLIEQARKTPR